MIALYTDGSYRDGIYTWAFEINDNGKIIEQKSGKGTDQEAAQMRNVAGELSAVAHGLKRCKELGITDIEIRYDYEGIGCWLQGQWKAKHVKVKQFIAYVSGLNLNLSFRWSKGHSGEAGNSRVDKLAHDALDLP